MKQFQVYLPYKDELCFPWWRNNGLVATNTYIFQSSNDGAVPTLVLFGWISVGGGASRRFYCSQVDRKRELERWSTTSD